MYKLIVLATFVAIGSAGIPYKECGKGEITYVEVSGCTTDTCHFVEGKQYEAKVVYKANQDTQNVKFNMSAVILGTEIDMSKDILEYTVQYPIKQGQQKQLTIKLAIPLFNATIETDVKTSLSGDHGDLFCGIFHA